VRLIADTYTIEGLLGRGGMGAVFVASHLRLPGKQVAVKVLHPEFVDDEIFARFQREAEIASRLGHPNIVSVLDFNITPEGVPYLVLELLEGRTLGDRIAAGPMTLARSRRSCGRSAPRWRPPTPRASSHRDLKPDNIFLMPRGGNEDYVKVLDFGISKIRGSMTVKTQESSLLGTPQYMAPEQAKGQHGEVDERSDLFALAAIVYEMLSGQPAFRGDSVAEVVFKVVYEPAVPLASLAPEVPPHALAAIERAMQKAPAARFASVAEFVEALTGEPLPTRAKRSSLIPVRAGASGSTRPGVGSAPGRAPAVAAGSGRVVGTEAAQLGVAATIGSAPGRAPTPVPLAIDATAVPAAPSVRSSAPGTGAGTAGPPPA
jgi:serine/threonine protein kinase